MKQIYRYITLAILLACTTQLFAQTYNGGVWYSLYSTTVNSIGTGNALSSSDKTITTYTSFVPNAGTFSYESKLPGEGKATATNTSSSYSDPRDYDVTNYQISFGGIKNTSNQSVSSSYSKSSKYIFPLTWYTHTYTYTYNYTATNGTGLNSELASIPAIYTYKSDNKNRTVYIKNVKVPMASHIRLVGGDYGTTSVTKTFTAVEWGDDDTDWATQASNQTVNFRSFLTKGNITVKLTSGDKSVWRIGTIDNKTGEITSSRDGYTYAVGSNQFAYNGTGKCSTGTKGKASGYDFVVYFCPQNAQDYTGTITITDGTSTATVTLKGTGKKQTPYIAECVSALATEVQYGSSVSSVVTGGVAKNNEGKVVAGTFTPSPTTFNGCTSTYTFTFTPTSTNLYNTTNNGSAITCTLPLSNFNFTKKEQTITWAASEAGIISGDLTLTATTSGHDATVYYTSSDESVATISGTRLIMHQPGKVTITAHADATCNYNAAPTVSHEFEMNKVIPTVTVPTASAITYGQTIAESTLSGGKATYNGATVSGTFSWVYPDLQPEVGTAAQLVQFTPDDQDRYAIITVSVNLKVNKITPTITWNIGTALREKTKYSEPATSTNYETGLTITTDNDKIYYDAEADKLIVGEMNQLKTTIQVTVTQEETEHYERKSVTYSSFVVLKKSKVCVDRIDDGNNQWHVDITDAETFADAMFDSDGGTVTWCNTNDKGEGKYRVAFNFDVEYTQYEGIQLGDWESGLQFNALGQMSNSGVYTNKEVVLSFTGVADAISLSTRTMQVKVISFNVTNDATNRNWELQESADMTNWSSVMTWSNGASSVGNASGKLKPDTRYVKIIYKGNFAGFIQNLRINRRHGFEYGADRNGVNEITVPQFGTEAHPLQVPQTISLRYYGIGSCGSEDDSIAVSSDNANFYADVEGINRSVDFDQYTSLTREYRLTIRCTEVGQTGIITLHATDGTELKLNVNSAVPEILANTGIHHTGTEQSHKAEGDYYRGMKRIDFSPCFDNDTPLFDSLYIFGVTGNTEIVADKFDYYDVHAGYWLPKVNIPDEETKCNAHTPLFVYGKDGNKYTYKRTIQNAAEEGLQNIYQNGKSLAFMGYCPFAFVGSDLSQSAFAYFRGDAGQTTDITLIETEILAREHNDDGSKKDPVTLHHSLSRGDNGINGSSAIFAIQSSSTSVPYNVRFHCFGDNMLRASDGAVVSLSGSVQSVSLTGGTQRVPSSPIRVYTTSSDTRLNLTIDDLWCGQHTVYSSLCLQPAAGFGSIDLGNSHTALNIDGGMITLKNGADKTPLAAAAHQTIIERDGQAAIVYGIGQDMTENDINITDGTILGESVLRLPYHTIITGGSYQSEQVECYEALDLPAVAPVNDKEKTVERQYLTLDAVPTGYGRQSVMTDEAGKFYPMLPTEEEREEVIDPWIAAVPTHADKATDKQNNYLLYMEMTENMQTQHSISDQYKEVSNTDNYQIEKRLSMLMQIHSADDYRMFVAPFDITSVYVLELVNESLIENLSKEEALRQQNAAQKEFYDYITKYITPDDGRATTMPLTAIINKYMQSHSGTGIYKLINYTGRNSRQASYHLYAVDDNNDGSTDTWKIVDDELIAAWKFVESTGVLMQRGRTYAINFPYCPNCTNFTGYDYWTDKFILLEGNGPQTIYGTAEAANNIDGAKTADDIAQFAGNASLKDVTATNVFTYNNETNLYTRQQSATLRPTESALFADARNSLGQIMRSISRDGHVQYMDADEWNPIMTSLNNTQNGLWQAQGATGEILIRSGIDLSGKIYTVSGQEIRTLTLSAGSTEQIALPQGIYLVSGNGEVQKVIVR